MENKVNYAVVGAFVLGVVLVAGILWLASGGAFQKKYDLYLAIEDESVAGLNLNAPVKYNGVDVGKVRQTSPPWRTRSPSARTRSTRASPMRPARSRTAREPARRPAP